MKGTFSRTYGVKVPCLYREIEVLCPSLGLASGDGDVVVEPRWYPSGQRSVDGGQPLPGTVGEGRPSPSEPLGIDRSFEGTHGPAEPRRGQLFGDRVDIGCAGPSRGRGQRGRVERMQVDDRLQGRSSRRLV